MSSIVRMSMTLEAIPSIQLFGLLEQDATAATIYLRRDEVWTVSVVTDDATLNMPEIDTYISPAEIYRDVELPRDETTGP
jgi:hypothetical protein